MCRTTTIFLALLAFAASSADAQDRYPVTIGLGAGYLAQGGYHAIAAVAVTPARSPVGLRLDGVWGHKSPGTARSNTGTALSASAVITLRPWRVAPYLLVGATRTGASASQSPFTGEYTYSPARTELTGGPGLSLRLGGGSLFGELRNLGRAGTPISIGFSF